jgi:hypothetical protein
MEVDMTVKEQITYQMEKPSFASLLSRALVAGLVALAANLLVYLLAPALFDFSLAIPIMGPGSPIQHLPFTMVAIVTLVATFGATILLALLNRFTMRPVMIFHGIAVVFLLLSFSGPFSLPVPPFVRITLASMHVITAAAVVIVLTASRK